jgi:hypothetical protein
MGLFSRRNAPEVSPPRRIAVAGTSFRQRDIVKAMGPSPSVDVDRGSEVVAAVFELKPDPRNPHDSRAVKVLAGGRHVGFIPRGHTDWAHKAISEGGAGSVKVAGQFVAYDGGDVGVVLPPKGR